MVVHLLLANSSDALFFANHSLRSLLWFPFNSFEDFSLNSTLLWPLDSVFGWTALRLTQEVFDCVKNALKLNRIMVRSVLAQFMALTLRLCYSPTAGLTIVPTLQCIGTALQVFSVYSFSHEFGQSFRNFVFVYLFVWLWLSIGLSIPKSLKTQNNFIFQSNLWLKIKMNSNK